MGSVQSEIVCKKCGYPEAMEDYYYRSGEVFVFCERCGYCFQAWRKGDGWNITSGGGYGAYLHTGRRGIGRGGQFLNKWSARKTIRRMIRYIKQPKHQNETITYTKKICGRWYQFNARTGEKELMEGMAVANG